MSISTGKTPELLIGNDIVDLNHADCRDTRERTMFLRRVFNQQELDRVEAAPDPDHSLWVHWAAKEAAYKALAGGIPGIRFAWQRYRVEPDLCVRFENHHLACMEVDHGDLSRHSVHVICAGQAQKDGIAPLNRDTLVRMAHRFCTLETFNDLIRNDPMARGLVEEHNPGAISGKPSEPSVENWDFAVDSLLVRYLARRFAAQLAGLRPDAQELDGYLVEEPGPRGSGIGPILRSPDDSRRKTSISHHGRYLSVLLSPVIEFASGL